jgi:hypothetical protein
MPAINDLFSAVSRSRARARLTQDVRRRSPGQPARGSRQLAPGIVIVAALGLLLAGCGSASTPGVAHLSSGKDPSGAGSEGGGSAPESAASAQHKLVAYSKCMRANGVPDFPEPAEGRLLVRGGPGTGLDPGSAQFQAAEKACHKLQPQGGKPSPEMMKQAQERALKFSACMRSHGEPNFPEPEFSGAGIKMTLKAGGAGGIDPRSPQFKAAQKACQQYFGPPGSKGGPLPAPPGAGASSQGGGPGASEHSEGVVAP